MHISPRWLLCLASLLLAPAALCWQPGEMRPLSFDEDVTAVAMGRWGGTALTVVGTSGQLLVLDPTGTELSRAQMAVADVLLADLDGNESAEFVVCGPGGIFLMRGAANKLGKPIEVSTEPCEAIARFVPDGPFAAVVSAAGGKVTVWAPEGNKIVPHGWEGEYEGVPLLVGDGTNFALAAAGAVGIQEESRPGRSLFATADPVRALVAGPAGWTWLTGTEQPQVIDLSREGTTVATTARGLLSADLNGGGTQMVTLHPDARSIGVLSEGNEILHSVPTRPQVGAAADLDGDGCAEVVLVETRSGVLLEGVCDGARPQVALAPTAPVKRAPATGELPTELVIGRQYADLTVGVGQTVDLQLVTPKNDARRWFFRGGPDGLAVSGDGHLTYTPEQQHVGLWSVSLRIREGAVSRWSGINLTVVE